FRAIRAVVPVDAHRACAGPAGVVDEIVPDMVATKGPVASGIDRADVARFQGDVMNFVELDEMLVARKENGTVRMIVNKIVRHAMAHASQQDGGHVTLRPAPLSLEMAILYNVSSRRERLPVPAIQRNSPIAGVRDVAPENAVAKSAPNTDANVADKAERATGDAI